MPCKINNNSDYNISEIENLIQDLFSFSQNRFGFKEEPVLNLISDDNNTSPLGKTAHYDPNSMEIAIYVDGRHPKDIMRSFSHELVHHNQNLKGEFANIVGQGGSNYAQTNPHLRKMEKEAYLKGNMCFRDWEDGYKSSNPNILNERRIYKMSIKDWKDKELNLLLNEKWGFSMNLDKLNEAKEKKPDFADIDGDGNKTEPVSKAAKDKKTKGEDDKPKKKAKKGEVPAGLKKHQEKQKKKQVMKEQEEDKTTEVAAELTRIDDIRKAIQQGLASQFPGAVLDNEATQKIIDVVLDAAAKAPTSLKTQAKNALDHYQVDATPTSRKDDPDQGGSQGGATDFNESRRRRAKKKILKNR